MLRRVTTGLEARYANGREVAVGTHIYRLETDPERETKKILVVR
jgi:hypothetical protein